MGIEIIQFGSETCLPCRAIREKIEHWAVSYPPVRYRYMPIEDHPEKAARAAVFTVPTVLVYVEGKLSIRASGYFSLDAILSKVERFIDLMN